MTLKYEIVVANSLAYAFEQCYDSDINICSNYGINENKQLEELKALANAYIKNVTQLTGEEKVNLLNIIGNTVLEKVLKAQTLADCY